MWDTPKDVQNVNLGNMAKKAQAVKAIMEKYRVHPEPVRINVNEVGFSTYNRDGQDNGTLSIKS